MTESAVGTEPVDGKTAAAIGKVLSAMDGQLKLSGARFEGTVEITGPTPPLRLHVQWNEAVGTHVARPLRPEHPAT